MMSREQIEQIARDFQLTVKERTDKLLEEDCKMYTYLGIDSTPQEKQKVKDISKIIYEQIKGFNEEVGHSLLEAFDE